MKILEALLQSKNSEEFAQKLLEQQREEEARAKERERELAENWKLRWKEGAKEIWGWIKFLFIFLLVLATIVEAVKIMS